MRKRFELFAVAACMLLAVVSLPAQAYVGPGAGISLLGALWALVAVIGSALLYVVLWPVRRWRRRQRQEREVRSRDAVAVAAETESKDESS